MDYTLDKIREVQLVGLEVFKEVIRVCEENKITYISFYGTLLGAVRHKGFIPWDDDIDIIMTRKEYEKFVEIAPKCLKSDYEMINVFTHDDFPKVSTMVTKKGTKWIPEHYKKIKAPIGINVDILICENAPDNEKELNKNIAHVWFWDKLLMLRNLSQPVMPYSGIKKKVLGLACSFIHTGLACVHFSRKFIIKKREKYAKRYENQNTQRLIIYNEFNPKVTLNFKKDIFPLKEMQYEDIMIKVPNNPEVILRNLYGNYNEFPPIDKRVGHMPYKLITGNEKG